MRKILENKPYTGIYDEFPKKEEEIVASPKPKEEVHTIESEILMEPTPNLVVKKHLDPGKQHLSEDDESRPLEFPFEFEEDLYEDYGNASTFPI